METICAIIYAMKKMLGIVNTPQQLKPFPSLLLTQYYYCRMIKGTVKAGIMTITIDASNMECSSTQQLLNHKTTTFHNKFSLYYLLKIEFKNIKIEMLELFTKTIRN